MATTLNNTMASARKNIFSDAAKRYVGFVSAFAGSLIVALGTNITSTVLQILAIAFLLIGFLLFSGNLKKMFKKQGSKETTSYFLIGLLLIILSILLFIFGGQISNWINLIIGCLIALYGLIILISYLIKRKTQKTHVINIIVSALLFSTGVLIALLFVISNSVFVMITGILSITTGALSMILY